MDFYGTMQSDDNDDDDRRFNCNINIHDILPVDISNVLLGTYNIPYTDYTTYLWMNLYQLYLWCILAIRLSVLFYNIKFFKSAVENRIFRMSREPKNGFCLLYHLFYFLTYIIYNWNSQIFWTGTHAFLCLFNIQYNILSYCTDCNRIEINAKL